MKSLRRFRPQLNPAQSDKDQMQKIAVGPGGNEERWTEWTEAVMKAWQRHTWSWDINGLPCTSYTIVQLAATVQVRRFRRRRVRQIMKIHAGHG